MGPSAIPDQSPGHKSKSTVEKHKYRVRVNKDTTCVKGVNTSTNEETVGTADSQAEAEAGRACK